jgi:hypothetical protein
VAKTKKPVVTTTESPVLPPIEESVSHVEMPNPAFEFSDLSNPESPQYTNSREINLIEHPAGAPEADTLKLLRSSESFGKS